MARSHYVVVLLLIGALLAAPFVNASPNPFTSPLSPLPTSTPEMVVHICGTTWTGQVYLPLMTVGCEVTCGIVGADSPGEARGQ